MNVLHGDLETIEAPGLRNLNLSTELFNQIFHNYPITSSKESQNILNKMFLIWVQFFPVPEILSQVNFISGPERSQMLLIHGIDGRVLDREEDKPILGGR